MVARGEVWWYEDPRVGRRPFLILTRDEAIPVLNQVLAVPATRTVRGIPTEVPLGVPDGMPTDCALTLDNVTLVRIALFTDRIIRLRAERMQEVCEALRIATAC
ncbi:MAG: type II toxin-antitoxin system PemK/MazF family toxin [Actinomycetota bacterium]|nr:type II toxin-antitoxin system PemK/MazF family toxin [Actinomycetota bacterium]